MTCKTRDLIHAARGPIDPAVEQHAAECAECGPALEALRHASAVLGAHHPARPSGAARARVWAGVEARHATEDRDPVWWPAFGGAVALAVIFLVALSTREGAHDGAGVGGAEMTRAEVTRTEPTAEPARTAGVIDGEVARGDAHSADRLEGPGRITHRASAIFVEPGANARALVGADLVDAPAGSSVTIAGTRVELASEARFVVDDTALDVTALRFDGDAEDVRIEGGTERALVLVTAETRLRVLGARVALSRTAAGTTVRVLAGDVVAWPRGRPLPVTLTAGEHLQLPAQAPAAGVTSTGELSHGTGMADAKTDLSLRTGSTSARDALSHGTGLGGANQVASARGPSERRDVAQAGGASNDRTPRAPRTEEGRAQSDEGSVRAANDGATPGGNTTAPTDAEAQTRASEAARDPKPSDVEALASRASAERRRGALAEAAELYATLARHPNGVSYREQALLERALILSQLSRRDEALTTLDEAHTLHPEGATAPERAALAAELYLAARDPVRAAAMIERVERVGPSPRLLVARVEVADELSSEDPARALTLVRPLLHGKGPKALVVRALKIAIHTSSTLGDRVGAETYRRRRDALVAE